MELSLIGLQNAGKTSLVDTIATGAYHEDMIPTVGFNMRKVAKGSVTIKLWDLGGQVCHRRSATAKHRLDVSSAPETTHSALCQRAMYMLMREASSCDCYPYCCNSRASVACGSGTAGECRRLCSWWTPQMWTASTR